ncbi:hypothetical protein PLICRDRAFT_100248 [Plicaturopsis crispa FD-325 SS-3]|nr:hypothetical protein PLICRDRAFT_100248 [Plicaturopsis crispa FD-325 SS-3]
MLHPYSPPTSPTHPRAHPSSPLQPSPFTSHAGRTRASSLPPLPSSDGIIISSPIRGNKDEQSTARRRKATRKRAQTVAEAQARKAAADQLEALEALEKAKRFEREKISFLDGVLDSLAVHDLTIGDLMIHVFDPIYKNAKTRWEGFFRKRGTARRILDLWASKENTPKAREQVHDWAVDYTASAVRSEAKSLTDGGYLRSLTRPLNAKFVQDFDMIEIRDHLLDTASVTMAILSSFSTSVRQLKSASPARMLKKSMVVTSSALQMLGEYSYANNFVKRIMGLYFFATGTQRQSMTVVSHLGLSESYSNLTAKRRKRKRKKPSGSDRSRSPSPVPGPTGTLRTLSESMMVSARSVAATGLYATVYDNINMVFHAAEQIMGRTDSQENGTCATIWPLWKASLENMRVSDLATSFDAAPPLSITDIILDETESKTFRRCLVHCVLRIVVAHGGDKFAKFSEDLERCTPTTAHKIEEHRTPLHPINASWSVLEEHATKIVDKYASSAVVADMRWRRQAQTNAAAANPLAEPSVPAGDMVFENAILFLRDALISREFTDAIKCGDSGRVVLVLKTWAIGFRGSGRTKYAHEMLHLWKPNGKVVIGHGYNLCHNISHVWPKGLRDIVFNNWLLNPTGRPNAWVEVDLMQEHMNYWIKNFYQAHGSSASWEWLGMIGPCVSILRYLVTSMNMAFGSYQGNRHATLNLTHDIPELMRSLANHEVYAEKGRILDDDDTPTVDIMSVGLQQLTDSSANPLHEYNRAFCNLQARRRLTPIVGDDDIEVVEARRAASMANDIDIDPPPTSPQGADAAGEESGEESEDGMDEDEFEPDSFIVDDEDGIELTLSRDNAEDVSLDMDSEDMAGYEYDGLDYDYDDYEEEADADS